MNNQIRSLSATVLLVLGFSKLSARVESLTACAVAADAGTASFPPYCSTI